VLGRLETEDLVSPIRGVGLGLRWEFLDDLVEQTAALEREGQGRLPVDFLEVSPENYMKRGGRYPAALSWLAERYPVVTHGLTISFGSPGSHGGSDPLDDDYLRDLAATIRELRSPWHSDHLCFSAAGGRMLHDLLPVSFKASNVEPIADRIKAARDAIGVPVAIENISFYWHPGRAEMGEAEFLARVCEAADCGLLLDVNNAYVNSINFAFDVDAWMRDAPLERVVQVHVAGHEWFEVSDAGIGRQVSARADGAMAVDTHGADVPDPVLSLLHRVLERTGPVPVVLERDQNVPELGVLLSEVDRIRRTASGARAR
jgi:uncharacterized protein (UPF0276 family)